MTTATCTGSSIKVFEFMEEYTLTSTESTHIKVIASDGVEWTIPLYNDDTYEVYDANGDRAIFVID